MKHLIVYSSVVLLAAALFACAPATHDTSTYTPPIIRRVLPNEITFSWIQINIFKPKCMDCHSAHHGDGDGLKKAKFDSYFSTMKVVVPLNPALSPLYTSVANQSMPKHGSPLSTHDLEVILDWIASGAPND